MSFSGDVKEEISRQQARLRHCQLAETAAILSMCGQVQVRGENRFEIYVYTENSPVARRFFSLIRRTFGVVAELRIRGNEKGNGRQYLLAIRNETDALRIWKSCCVLPEVKDWDEDTVPESMTVLPELLEKSCCRRAFLRGAFLASGSMSDPEKSYHLEYVCLDEKMACLLKDLLASFDIETRIVERKKYVVLYLKDGDQISETLNVMEAHVAMMNLENVRILKEMRGSINRQVNCEAANIQKTVSAANAQMTAIRWLYEQEKLTALPDSLKEMARVRWEHPEATLQELGSYLDPPVGKSGVNHRLRKLKEYADRLREESKE